MRSLIQETSCKHILHATITRQDKLLFDERAEEDFEPCTVQIENVYLTGDMQ